MKNVCVYLGSNPGTLPDYGEMARTLAREIAVRGLTLVYGGSLVGTMGMLADACLEAGGRVVGVIPGLLKDKEIAHEGLSELHVVASMAERKLRMMELSDGFVALPGGYGTLDEYFEALTWTQLGLHAKPCSVLDVAGYYGTLLDYLRHAEANGFIKPQHLALSLYHTDPAEMLEAMAAWKPSHMGKWTERPELD